MLFYFNVKRDRWKIGLNPSGRQGEWVGFGFVIIFGGRVLGYCLGVAGGWFSWVAMVLYTSV